MTDKAQLEGHERMDNVQQRLASYVHDLSYDALPADTVHAAKVRIIDTLGALLAGFFGEACRLTRDLASQVPSPSGATVIGTRMKTTPDLAAFVNCTTARYPELTDSYRYPGSALGHPSDVITPALAAAEHNHASGRELIAGIVVAYEVFLRLSDVFHKIDPDTGDLVFDHTIFTCLGSAVAAGKLFRLSQRQLAECVAMAMVPNVILRQVRKDYVTMFKAVTSGNASRAGVFAAMMARTGIEGPNLPFEGTAGWCKHVLGAPLSFDVMGGNGTPFKICSTIIKPRACAGSTIACILAGEKIAPLANVDAVERVIVEVPEKTKIMAGTGEANWAPTTREGADHSGPYVVAVTLMEGTVSLRSYDDAHLWNPKLRAFMRKIEMVENKDFTEAYNQVPVQHRTRITVLMHNGERLVGEAGGEHGDMAERKSDAQIEDKFRGLTEEYLGATRVRAVLDRLWQLDDVVNAAELPHILVLG